MATATRILLTAITVLALATCGAAQAGPSPSATVSGSLSPADAAKAIRETVKGARPLLVPNDIPDSWTATVRLDANAFNATFRSPDRVATVTLAIAAANPPLPGPNTRQVRAVFHGDANSLYQVTDDRIPTSQRILVWVERGFWGVSGRNEVPYVLSSEGLSDTEFWRIANGLHPNQL
jgi:hypothetical protein